MNPDDFCRTMLALDDSIRFVGIASLDLEARHFIYRHDIVPFLNNEETELSLLDATVRTELRRIFEPQFGDCNFIFASHAKAKKITVPIREEPGKYPAGILELTMELNSDHEKIINKKVLPTLERSKRDLISSLAIRQRSSR